MTNEQVEKILKENKGLPIIRILQDDLSDVDIIGYPCLSLNRFYKSSVLSHVDTPFTNEDMVYIYDDVDGKCRIMEKIEDSLLKSGLIADLTDWELGKMLDTIYNNLPWVEALIAVYALH